MHAEQQAFKVGVMPTLDCLPLFVAKETGLFDSLHVDVRLKRYTAQMDIDTALLRGRVEMAVTDRIRMEHLTRKGLTLDTFAIVPSEWVLVSRQNARLKEMSQMGDKMIAMTRFSATDYLTDKALENVKTSAQVFRVQINDVSLRLRMILNSTMDAAWLPEPQASIAVGAGNVVMKRSNDVEGDFGRLVVRSAEMDDARRAQQLDLLTRAYNQAVDSIGKHGVAHYAAVIGKYCDCKPNTKLPPTNFKKVISDK
ncbi:MAG: ABC transporter substrate-binding protein [Prevotella sp.]|nr:ABC transporter substrate-binding protein [Prevotella sp.]